jgi:hypothetical protein
MPITMIISLLTGKAKKPLLIALMIALVLLVLTGYTVAEHQFLKEKDQAVDAAIKALKQKNQSNQQIAATYWKNELAKQPKIQTIEKRIIEYVQVQDPDDTDCQLDDNELFILQDLVAIANANSPQTEY